MNVEKNSPPTTIDAEGRIEELPELTGTESARVFAEQRSTYRHVAKVEGAPKRKNLNQPPEFTFASLDARAVIVLSIDGEGGVVSAPWG